MRTTDTHVFFWGEEFSNWYSCNFKYNEQDFHNTEQAFMSRKAAYFEDWEIFEKILKDGADPKEAKKLGRKVKNFNTNYWMDVCLDEMIDVNLAKYNQNEDLKQILLDTGDMILVEASPYDKIWGIGLGLDNDDCLDETKWRGMNLLGKALMEVRNQIRNEENN